MSDKKNSRERLAELIGPDSTNFLDTGLTMPECIQLGHAEKLATSWAIQSLENRRRRLQTVIRLSQELARIQETTEFSVRLAELAIEAVIEGDQKTVEEWTSYFTFTMENNNLRRKCAPIYETFRELLLQALRSAKEMPA